MSAPGAYAEHAVPLPCQAGTQETGGEWEGTDEPAADSTAGQELSPSHTATYQAHTGPSRNARQGELHATTVFQTSRAELRKVTPNTRLSRGLCKGDWALPPALKDITHSDLLVIIRFQD